MERLRVAIQKARAARAEAEASGVVIPGVRRASAPGWDLLQTFEPNPKALAKNRVVTLSREDSGHTAFDMLRTRVLAALREQNIRIIGITSPTSACGKSTVALNLAFSFARQADIRTVLIDLDLRRPAIANYMGVSGWAGVENYLEGEELLERCFFRFRDNLAVAVNSGKRSNPAELLQHKKTTEAMRGMMRDLRPDVVIVDLPPVLSCDDVWAFLPNLEGVILVAAADHSSVPELDNAERDLAEKANLLGVVLNQCRIIDETYSQTYS